MHTYKYINAYIDAYIQTCIHTFRHTCIHGTVMLTFSSDNKCVPSFTLPYAPSPRVLPNM
jgi:hypothetical protein